MKSNRLTGAISVIVPKLVSRNVRSCFFERFSGNDSISFILIGDYSLGEHMLTKPHRCAQQTWSVEQISNIVQVSTNLGAPYGKGQSTYIQMS